MDLGSVGAIAAVFTAIVEPGGGYQRHATVYGLVTAMNVVVVVLAVSVANAAIAAAVVMLALGMLAGLASAWGSVPTLVAPAPLGLFILTQGIQPTPRMTDAVLAVLVGSGWVVAMSVIPWPIAPFAPAKMMVGDAWLSVAAFARDVESTRLEAGAVTAIEQARDMVSAIRSRRPGWSDRSQRLWGTLMAAQRVTALLSAVADDRRRDVADTETRAAMAGLLAAVNVFAADLAANAVMPRAHPEMADIEAAARRVDASLPTTEGRTGAPLHQALVSAARARTAKRLLLRLREGAEALDLPDPPDVTVPIHRRDDWVARVRATLSWHSTALRHGLRLGAACGITMGVFTALGPEGALGVAHGSWVTITLMFVLRPTLGDSVESVIQRSVGTVIGGIIAIVMLAALPAGVALSLGIVGAAALAALLLPINVLWYVVLFTPIPLVFATSTTGAGTDIFVERLIATGLACGAGLIIATLVWPTREGRHLPRAVAEALRSDARALDAMIAVVVGEALPGTASRAQFRAMRTADEATRIAQVQFVESLKAFLHPRPIISLEAAVLRLPREIAGLGARVGTHGIDIPGIESVRGKAVQALNEIAAALEAHRIPNAQNDLLHTLDPAWKLLSHREAEGIPDAPLAAAIDSLDSILHTIVCVADDAATCVRAGTSGSRGGSLWHRLLPAPKAGSTTA